MKLLVVGSRSITNFDLSPYISNDVDVIISGGAEGVDKLAEQYADLHRISKYIIRPQYNFSVVPLPFDEMNKWLTWQMPYSLFGTENQKEHSIPFNMQTK